MKCPHGIERDECGFCEAESHRNAVHDAVDAIRAAGGIFPMPDDDHHTMMNGPRIAQSLGAKEARECVEVLNREPMSREAFADVQRVNRLERALQWLLAYHPESPETGAELPREAWLSDYRNAVDYAKRALSLGGGGLGKGENASPKEATDNIVLADTSKI